MESVCVVREGCVCGEGGGVVRGGVWRVCVCTLAKIVFGSEEG